MGKNLNSSEKNNSEETILSIQELKEAIKTLKKKNNRLIDDEYGVIKTKFVSLLESITQKSFAAINDSLDAIQKGMDASSEMLKIVVEKSEFTPKQISMLLMMNYLVMIEAVFSEIIQLITFLLVENHHDIYDTRKGKFVNKYTALDKIDLQVKIQFLEKHGFKIVVDKVDRQLRNYIAHSRYDINDDGTIYYRDIKLTQKNMLIKLDNLRNINLKTWLAFAEAHITIKTFPNYDLKDK